MTAFDPEHPEPHQDELPLEAAEADVADQRAEELDEDRLQMDPLEEGMDPPEHWSGVDKYGMTPYEQRHPRGLDQRLDEEQPDIQPRYDDSDHEHAVRTGRSADEAGGSMAETIRTPEEPPL